MQEKYKSANYSCYFAIMTKFSLIIGLLFTLNAMAATSREERQNKTFELSFQLGGWDYRMSPYQVAGMYFLNSDNLIGLKAGVDSSGEERQTNIALQNKHYFSNSFYAAGEIFYLNSREDVTGLWGDLLNLQDYAEYVSTGAHIRIGNQWTWKHFTVGCDWIGIGHRVGTFRKDTDDLNANTFTLLNVIAGISF
jgi:hypothetical protein